jgi:hypothetical protein
VTYRPVFHARIEADVREAMGRYEAQSPGLGERFKRMFYAVEHDVVYVLTVQYAGRKPAYLRRVAQERRTN